MFLQMKKVEKNYNCETLKMKALKTLKVEHAVECSEMTLHTTRHKLPGFSGTQDMFKGRVYCIWIIRGLAQPM
jgi:hypothetical protein